MRRKSCKPMDFKPSTTNPPSPPTGASPPCTTHKNEPAATGHERFESLPSPFKDLQISRTTNHPGNGLTVSSHSSCKNRRKECRLSAKKRKGAPEGAVFCALRNPARPPEFLSRSIKCAAFDADLVAAPAPCRSGGGSEGGEALPLIPTTREVRENAIRDCRQTGDDRRRKGRRSRGRRIRGKDDSSFPEGG